MELDGYDLRVSKAKLVLRMANVGAPPFTVVSAVKGVADLLKSGFGTEENVELVYDLNFVCGRMGCVTKPILVGDTVKLSDFAVVRTEVATSETVTSLDVDPPVSDNRITVEELKEVGTVELMNFGFWNSELGTSVLLNILFTFKLEVTVASETMEVKRDVDAEK